MRIEVPDEVIKGVLLPIIFWSAILFFLDVNGNVDLFDIPSPPYPLTYIIMISEPIIMTILTYWLYTLYKQQKNILEDQRDLSEYQQSSLLRIENHRAIEIAESKNVQDEKADTNIVLNHTEYVETELSNFGRAPAHDLTLELFIKTKKESMRVTAPLIQGRYKDVISNLYSTSVSPHVLNNRGQAISPDRSNITFTSPLILHKEKIPSSWLPESTYIHPPPHSILEYIKESTDSDVTLGLLFWYKDGRGENDPIMLRFVKCDNEDLVERWNTKTTLDLHELFSNIGEDIGPSEYPDLSYPQ